MLDRFALRLAAVGALAAAAACTDRDPTGPGIPRHAAPTRPHLSIAVSSPEIAMLSVEVTAPDLRDALVYDLDLQDGRSESSLALPAGAERRLVIRGHDRYGEVTHEGEAFVEKVAEGENPYIEAELKPVGEGKEARAEIGLVGEEPREATIELRAEQREPLEGESFLIKAAVLDPSGKPLDVRPDELHWAVSDPRGAHVQPLFREDVIAEILAMQAVGEVRISATYRDHISWIYIYIQRNPYVAVSAGSSHSCALRQNGDAYCWGNNSRGQLGTTAVPSTSCSGTVLCRSATPVYVAGYAFTAISAAGNDTCALTSVGQIYCWGNNYSGQLGDGTVGGQSPTPVLVKSKVTFIAVTTGYSHACGLASTGAAFCWGDNGSGQLGTGNTTASPVPVLVQGGLHFRSLSAGGGHSCGIADISKETIYPAAAAAAGAPRTLASTTQMVCWGSSYWGQLGNGQSGAGVFATLPVAVNGGGAFATLGDYESSNTSCAITASGTGYCWGDNYTGQLGTGNTTPVATPAAVAGGLSFTGLGTSSFHSCGVTTASDIYCWGFNGYGQLGNPTSAGTASNVLSLVPVVGGHKFSQVTVGFNHSCGLRTDGRILCWGTYSGGELGNGMTGLFPSWTNTPVLVL